MRRGKKLKSMLAVALVFAMTFCTDGVASNISKNTANNKGAVYAAGTKTIKGFLSTGLEPMGTTMYTYGGGWNEEDNGAGTEARTIGLSSRWAEFASQQTSSYNYKDYDYKTNSDVIHLGLDCSGYVGWVLYNTLDTTSGNEGYVDYENKVLEKLQNQGYGTLTMAANVKDYKPGDIMKTPDHMWIVVGPCSDGSVVLMHSSPPGVQFSGTPTPSGNTNSEAVTIATYYKKTYYSSWYERYPDSSKGMSYLSGYNQFRWNTSGAFSDPEGYQNMTAVEVLKDLLGSVPPGYETTNTTTEVSQSGTWKKDSKGWWYEYSDGSYPAAKWLKIDNIWYYFKSNGYMATGWQKDAGCWYYLDSSGAMQTGWVKDKGVWYYLNSGGDMATGWVESDGSWYYLKSSGAMAAGEYIGKYYVDKSGKWVR